MPLKTARDMAVEIMARGIKNSAAPDKVAKRIVGGWTPSRVLQYVKRMGYRYDGKSQDWVRR